MLSDYPDILTTEDACKLLKVSRHTIYQLIQSNALKAKKIARQYRIKKSDLIYFLDED